MKHRTLTIILVLVGCLILVSSISGAGRRWMSGVASLFKSSQPAPTPSAPTPSAPTPRVQPTGDVESNARAQHGWSSSVADSVVYGKIAYYDDQGNQTSAGQITLYRVYPDLLRLEVEWTSGKEVYGIDNLGAWVEGKPVISDDDMREIRAFLRIWPERLFIARSQGAPYREVGIHREDFKLAGPGQPSLDVEPGITFDQVQVEDTLQVQPSEKRRVYYYVNQSNSRVSALRYPEPDDPNADALDPQTDSTEARVDFDDWHTVNNILWPYLITHRLGGKVDFRIWVSEVTVNQSPSPDLFRRQ